MTCYAALACYPRVGRLLTTLAWLYAMAVHTKLATDDGWLRNLPDRFATTQLGPPCSPATQGEM